MEIKYGPFEVRPITYLNIGCDDKDELFKKRDNEYEIVKWEEHEPYEVTDFKTGEKTMSTRNCYTIATLKWTGGKEPYFKFESCGDRFLQACIDNENSTDYDNKVEWYKFCDWIMTVEKMLEANVNWKEGY